MGTGSWRLLSHAHLHAEPRSGTFAAKALDGALPDPGRGAILRFATRPDLDTCTNKEAERTIRPVKHLVDVSFDDRWRPARKPQVDA
jgi:hypothetical protein